MSVIQRCALCNKIIDDDEDFREGVDDPELCELCNEVADHERPGQH